MTDELRKRLEEAAKIMQREATPHKDWGDVRYGFSRGAAFGFKEAIKVAKEWLIEHTVTRMPEEDDKDFVWVESDRYEDKEDFIARFETDMNKLSEGDNMEKTTISRKHEGWLNIYTMGNPKESFTGQTIYESEEKAKNGAKPCCATTIKIEWEDKK